MLDTDQIFLKYNYYVAESVTPANTSKDLTKSLYEKEGGMNSFEEKVINEVANLSNILCWTRNMERKGYCINGFVNHYPDFIIYTKSGKVVLLETKGDHLDAEPKIRLGNLWTSKCSNEFKYFMVYEHRSVRDAYTQEAFMQIIRNL
jgi:type III restriction enzyme